MRRMVFRAVVCALVVGATDAVASGWKFSVGGAFSTPAKANLMFSRNLFRQNGVSGYGAGMTSEEARRIALGNTEGTRTEYGKYGDAVIFVDTEDYGSLRRNGNRAIEDGTWNVCVPYDSWNGSSFVLSSAEYDEVSVIMDGSGGLVLNGSDDSAMNGVSVDMSRELIRDDRHSFGMDLAIVGSYFFAQDLYNSMSAYQSDTAVREKGKWESSVSPVSGVREEGRRHADGTYGNGAYAGPGPVFKYPVIEHAVYSRSRTRRTGFFGATGDYREFEMMLQVRPFCDVTEWLRIYGILGCSVAWHRFNLDVMYLADSDGVSYRRSYSSWDVYGVGGLGVQLNYGDFFITGDFAYRFLDDPLEVNDEVVNGRIECGDFVGRLMVGYSF